MNDHKIENKSHSGKIIYILQGDPTLMVSSRFNGPAKGTGRRNRTVDSITISSQMNEFLDLKAPLKLNINFFFAIPHRANTKRPGIKPGDYHVHYPDVINCTRYIEDVCKGILFQENFYIASVETSKFYDDPPRTEFFLTQL